METNSSDNRAGLLGLMVQHPAVQDDIAGFVTLIIQQALSITEVRQQVVTLMSEPEFTKLLSAEVLIARRLNLSDEEKVTGRQQVTARDAAKMLRYNPRYFNRKAKDWGLTKIRMSRTSCRYYLDEVEQLAIERGIRKIA